tara:strand:+ start:384 stop:734 length:351 start_codon:yes stop_codon:yes gene_type:complete
MESNNNLSTEAVIFTDAAAMKVGSLLTEEENPNLHLRVYVTGGGCAGFQYGFSFDENKDEGDTEVVKRGVRLIVDPMSIQYLMGAEIDFQEDLQGARFVIKNPNATTTCSCGSSFS